jgi:uncharacterized protein YdeI (BOF family)
MAQEYQTPGTSRSAPREVGLVGYIVPAVVAIVVVVVAVSYWRGRDPTTPEEEQKKSILDAPKPGGFDPQPGFESTREELEHRGATAQGTTGTLGAITQIRQAAAAEPGRQVKLTGEVGDAPGADRFWIQDGKDRVEVRAPTGVRSPRAGERVSVTGVVELESGTRRIRAERIATE